MQEFLRKPFGERLKDTAFLLKHSFSVIGRDTDILKPVYRMLFLSLLIRVFIFASLLSFFLKTYIGWGVLLLLFTLFILIPFNFFYKTRQKACESWIVYNTIIGNNIDYGDAHTRTKPLKGTLRAISFIDLFMAYAKGQRRQNRGGLGQFLINIFISALAEAWDLLSHYMLPAVVIEQKKLKELLPQLKALRNNVPASLVGVFGIDFVGHVVGSLLFPLYIFFLALSVGLGYLLTTLLPETVWTIFSFSFSWVPVFIVMFVIFIVGLIVKLLVESTKVIYFTIFYTALMQPSKIITDLRQDVTNYLLMKR